MSTSEDGGAERGRVGGELPQVWDYLDPGAGLAGRQQAGPGGREGDAGREVPLPGGRDSVGPGSVWVERSIAGGTVPSLGLGLGLALEQTKVLAGLQKHHGETGGEKPQQEKIHQVSPSSRLPSRELANS